MNEHFADFLLNCGGFALYDYLALRSGAAREGSGGGTAEDAGAGSHAEGISRCPEREGPAAPTAGQSLVFPKERVHGKYIFACILPIHLGTKHVAVHAVFLWFAKIQRRPPPPCLNNGWAVVSSADGEERQVEHDVEGALRGELAVDENAAAD